jgi:hypothetical protein
MGGGEDNKEWKEKKEDNVKQQGKRIKIKGKLWIRKKARSTRGNTTKILQ